VIVSSIFSFLLNNVLSSFAQSFSQAASSFLAAIFQALNASTSLSLSGRNFLTEFDAVFEIGLLLAILLAFIELGAAALARDAKRIMRVPLNLLLMVTGTIVSVTVVNLLLGIADQLSVGLLHATGFTLSSTEMGVALAAIATEPATVLVMAGFMILACISIYLALVARQVLIVVAAVLAPLAFSGTTSKWTHNWWRRWAEMMLGLIFSKVVLVIILITGFHVMAGLGSTNVISAISSLIGGVGLLMAGAFAPLFSMKMMHFTGGQFANAAGLGHHFASAAVEPVQKASKVGAAVASGGALAGLGAATGLHVRGGSKEEPGAGDTGNGGVAPRPSSPPTGGGSGPEEGGGGAPRPSAPTPPRGDSGPSSTAAPAPKVADVETASTPGSSRATTTTTTTTGPSTSTARTVERGDTKTASEPASSTPAPKVADVETASTPTPTATAKPIDTNAAPASTSSTEPIKAQRLPGLSRVARAVARARATQGAREVAPPAMVTPPPPVPVAAPASGTPVAASTAGILPTPSRLPDDGPPPSLSPGVNHSSEGGAPSEDGLRSPSAPVAAPSSGPSEARAPSSPPTHPSAPSGGES
jgi:DNA processing protein